MTESKEAGSSRIRRRNRMITSCLECRRRKLKCDKLQPCTNCKKFSRDCMFLAPALDSVSQKKLNELKDKMGSLEKVLENDIARRVNTRPSTPIERKSPGDLPGEESESGDEGDILIPEDEKPLEFSPLAVSDTAYEDTVNEDLLDLGVRIGRMRLNERFGGTYRPRFAEELASVLGEPIDTGMTNPNVLRLADHQDFLAPGPTFIAPGSGFVFGDVGPRRNIVDFLPSKSAADSLVQNYYYNVHFIARAVHWPSFQLQYENFWSSVLSGYEPQASLQAVVFAVLFSATASMEEDDIYNLFGSGKSAILTGLQTATEVALGKANYLRTSKIETLQALVIYLIPMVRDEVSRAHSVLVSSAIRLAECMGLHRDPEIFGLSPIGTHVRRILWYQLCYLDYRSSETQAPRPYIKRENYDTKFPLDVNDHDLMMAEPKERSGVWTDMTLTRLRFECAEMWRVTQNDAERLRRKKISITHALEKAEHFRRAMEAKYDAVIDTSIPIQAYAKHFLTTAMARLYITILHRYHHSTQVQIPDRLREIVIVNAVEAMEHFIALQKTPEFRNWQWYSNCITTWHPAMLMLLEIFVYPQRREADRIWAIIDYTYQPDPHLSRELKARQILNTIRDRAAYYRDMRQIREPVDMPSGQITTLSTRGGRPKTTGSDGIYLKQEESEYKCRNDDFTCHSPPSRKLSVASSTPQSRKPSIANPVDLPSAMDMTQVPSTATDGWPFETPSTMYLPPGAGMTQGSSPHSGSASATSMAPMNGTLTQTKGLNVLANPLPGLDYGHSPGSSSTNTDSWPPSLSNEQPSGFNVSPPKLALDAPRELRRPTLQSTRSNLGNMYLPQGYPSQLPCIAGSQGGVETILQMTNSGYLPEDTTSLDIDWGEWDKIFPPDVNTGNIDHPQIVTR